MNGNNEYMLDNPLDDDGNAQCVAKRHSIFLHNDAYGWIMYCGTHWRREGAESELHKAIVETLRSRAHELVDGGRAGDVKYVTPSAARVKNIVFHLRSILYVSPDEFSAHPDLLNCKNCVVSLKTGQTQEHSVDQRFLYCIPTPYVAGRRSEDWERFLSEVVADYDSIKDWLRMAIGYSITGRTNEEILFYIHGPRRSGKGTFANTLADTLGTPIAIGVDFASFTSERDGDSNNFDLAGLQQTRVVISSETSRYDKLSPKRIKNITGRDPIRTSFKHRDLFEYYPSFKLWLQSNWDVSADPDDDALWSRVRVVSFPKSFYGKEDKGLKDRLSSESNRIGILSWAIEGAQRWYANGSDGLVTPQSVIDETVAQQIGQDYIQQFLEECVESKTDWLESSKAVYQAYRWWCEENGVTPKHQNQLTASLKAKGFESGRGTVVGNQTRCIFGLRLLTQTVKLNTEI